MFTINEDHPLHTKKKFPLGGFLSTITDSSNGKKILSVSELMTYSKLVTKWCDVNCPQAMPLSTSDLAWESERDIRTIQRHVNKLLQVGLLEDCGYQSGPNKIRLVSIASYTPIMTVKPIPRPRNKPIKIPDNIINLMKYWQSKELLPILKWPKQDDNGFFIEPTKVIKEAKEHLQNLLDGTLFAQKDYLLEFYKFDLSKKFSEREIRTAIDRFAICATQAEFFPHDKDKVRKFSLSKFIWNPFGKNVKFWSWFLFCHKTCPELLSVRIKKPIIDVSETYENLKRKYAKFFCAGDEDHFTESDEMNFIYAGNELAGRVTAWKKYLKPPLDSNSASKYFIESIQANLKPELISSKQLKMESTFTNLAVYLHEKDIFRGYRGWRMRERI